MANSNVILGSDLMLFCDSGATALACATSCKLSISAGELETSSKDSGKWTSKQAGKLSWSASSDNLFVLTEYSSLVDKMIERKEIEIQFSVASNADNDTGIPTEGWTASANGYKGKAIIISVEANASDGDNATYSVQFAGTGALTKVA